ADAYREHPELFSFISSQKMPWKQSKTLAGEIGEYIVVARKSAEDVWLVGSATSEEKREIRIPLDFLDAGEYTASIFEDAADAHYTDNREAYTKRVQKVTAKDVITAKLAPGGGHCMILKRK
ncbi:glycoside hydrolase family 97 C-terminal domain-containing protein, partial [Verrucomicrobiota bacterium]